MIYLYDKSVDIKRSVIKTRSVIADDLIIYWLHT